MIVPTLKTQKKKFVILLAFLVIANIFLLLLYLNPGSLSRLFGIAYSCPHLKGASCARPEKIKLPGIKGEGVVLAYKTPPGTALYSPVDGSMMVFAKPFFVVREGERVIRLPGIIVYKLNDKGKAEYAIYFIVRHNIKGDRISKIVKEGEKIAEITGNVYKGYSILVGVDRFDRKRKKFVVDERLLDKIFLKTE